ncbi:MAG: DUF3379 family protein [Pseudomonadota bacterium]
MDDIEFRRAILADPNAQTDEIKEAIKNDPSKQQFVDEMRDFEAMLEDAMDVDVPSGLEAKLLQRQPVIREVEPPVQTQVVTKARAANDRSYWQIAAAACFAFVIGLSINMNFFQPGNSNGMGAGDYALKHTYQGLQNVSQYDAQIPLDQLNAQLVHYGVQMEQEIGEVLHANSFFCGYNLVNVLHLVVGGEAGNISMFVLPKDNKLESWNEFSDGRYSGTAARYSNADFVIVGEKEEPLGAFQSKVENSMKWKI